MFHQHVPWTFVNWLHIFNTITDNCFPPISIFFWPVTHHPPSGEPGLVTDEEGVVWVSASQQSVSTHITLTLPCGKVPIWDCKILIASKSLQKKRKHSCFYEKVLLYQQHGSIGMFYRANSLSFIFYIYNFWVYHFFIVFFLMHEKLSLGNIVRMICLSIFHQNVSHQ